MAIRVQLKSGRMATIPTKYFGDMVLDQASCFEFPWGLPAFEDERCFLPIEIPHLQPLLFLQSASNSGLCFIALPVLAADPGYQLAVSPDDLEALELSIDRQPAMGSEVLVLALLSIYEEAPPTANLLAPVVINVATRRGLQAIRHDGTYSHNHPLASRVENRAC